MKVIISSGVFAIALLVSMNSFAVESVDQTQVNTENVLTKGQRQQQRQLFLKQQKQVREERNKMLRAQHAEKYMK